MLTIIRSQHRQTERLISRRKALLSLASLAAGAAAATGLSVAPAGASGGSHLMRARANANVLTASTMTFVLVHGGWHGGWCWSRVAPLLRVGGHEVLTPTLSGLADRAHLLTRDVGLETHIDDIVGLLDYHDLEEVVLVGHSYAGMVITGAAARRPERVAHVAYLDAFVPAKGDSLTSLLAPEREYYYRQQAATRGQGWRVPPPPVAALGVTDVEDAAWLEAKLTDQPLRSFDEPLQIAAPANLARTYIHCTEGPIVASFAPFAATARQDPTWNYAELATGHDAMITEPNALADVLLNLQSTTAS